MNDHSPEELPPPQFTLRSLFVVIAVVALLLGLTLPAIQRARQSARRTECARNLLQIGLGLHNYQDVHGSFPAASWQKAEGQPDRSWRVAVSPFLESSPFYRGYSLDQPWNSPGNLSAGQTWASPVYRCPSGLSAVGMTDYLAVTGAMTAWPVPAARRLQDFSKGTSQTILVVEHVYSGIHWLEPRDLPFDQLDFTILGRSPQGDPPAARRLIPALVSEHQDGANVVFADGSFKFLPTDTSPNVLKDLLLVIDKANAEASSHGTEAVPQRQAEKQ
jgi:prepilin-type processing-associated H-X9-DG protein